MINNILYVSSVCSSNFIENLRTTSNANPGLAVQNFNRQMASGLVKNNCHVTLLSNPPITRSNSDKLFVNFSPSLENELRYNYIPFINVKYIKHLCVFIYSFFYTILWSLKYKNTNRTVICDVLSKSAAMGSLLASKISGNKSVGIVTDLPWMVVPEGLDIRNKPKCSFVYFFTHYIFLTEQMNSEINQRNRPYVVIEGLCKERDELPLIDESILKKDKCILYAGTLMEKYGIKKLVESFLKVEIPDFKLVIYGDGSFAQQLRSICENTNKIEYRGLASTDTVFQEEQKAILLVNPRPSQDIYTEFSFPSKTMEYMASGTPLLTTKLPGIPSEYNDFLYYFDDESTDGFTNTINRILQYNLHELRKKGMQAQDFVFKNKNSRVQTAKIIKMLD